MRKVRPQNQTQKGTPPMTQTQMARVARAVTGKECSVHHKNQIWIDRFGDDSEKWMPHFSWSINSRSQALAVVEWLCKRGISGPNLAMMRDSIKRGNVAALQSLVLELLENKDG
jgi:hypothetical protein